MERAEWLKQMRERAEKLYDQYAPLYWVSYGLGENETHREFLRKFLERVRPGGPLLSAGCGAGRYDGLLLEAGHPVVGIDQSAGMLQRAREHFPQAQFPQLRYEKMGMQEIPFRDEFDGVICVEALEHVCPEDYPSILKGFSQALRSEGWLYFNVDNTPSEDLMAAYQRAKDLGLPVVLGELVDRTDEAYEKVKGLEGIPPDEWGDAAVYHFYPTLEQVREWLAEAGLTIEAEGEGSGYYHFLARKAN